MAIGKPKRGFEEVAVDDGSKSPKQPKRPREEFDEHAAGIGNSLSQDKGPPMVDDGSTDSSTLVLQQNVEKGAEKDSVIKEVAAPVEDYDSSDYSETCNVGVDDGYLYGCCESCVKDEICKECGNLNGIPPRGWSRKDESEDESEDESD